MEIARIQVNGTRAKVVSHQNIPAGIIGATVSFEYTDPMWDSLVKTVVFKGAVTKDVPNAGSEVELPAEVVAREGVRLKIGVYGTNADNTVAVPTFWADVGKIHDATDPSGDESTEPTLPVWSQILQQIGDIGNLDTQDKENLVSAINEIAARSGGEVDPEYVQEIVEQFLIENPPAPGEKGEPGVDGKPGADGYSPVKGTDYWTDADKAEMVNDVLAALPVYNGEVEPI